MTVPLLDLKPQYAALRDRILPRIAELLDSQELILGPAVERFEQAVCDYTGSPHAIGMSSGSDALLAVLMALEIGPGDAVITTPYTFFATAGAIHRLGATMVFVDIEPETFNMSVEALRAAVHGMQRGRDGALLTAEGQRVRAIMPVHLFGQTCELDPIAQVACEHDLPVIEDAAQALGAVYPAQDGTLHGAGSYGAFGCYSFYPTKNLGGCGDGGMVVCREKNMADKLRTLRNHGMENRYYHHLVGGNFRLDALQAAVLEIKLPYLDEWSSGRRRNAKLYREAFAQSGLGGQVKLPVEIYADRCSDERHHIFNQFVVRCEDRDALMQHLAACGIGHAVYYPLPLHLQPCFASLGYRAGDFAEAELAAKQSLALPIFPELKPEQIVEVVRVVQKFYAA